MNDRRVQPLNDSQSAEVQIEENQDSEYNIGNQIIQPEVDASSDILEHPVDQFLQDTGLHTNSTVLNMKTDDVQSATNSQTKRYLFPLIFYGCGPCEQYSFFGSGIVNSMKQNRSIVTIPFHNNHLQNKSVVRTINETFDYTKLRQIVGLTTIDEFINACGTDFTPRNVLLGPEGYPVKKESRELRLHYYDFYVRKMQSYVPHMNLPTREEVQQYQESVAENSLELSYKVKCIFFVTAVHFYYDYSGQEYDDIMTRISKNYVRAPYIRKLADDAIQQISGGLPYAALHWRNRSAE